MSLKSSVKITLAVPGGDRGDTEPKVQRNEGAFNSRAWEEEGKIGERGKIREVKKEKSSEVVAEE